MVLRNYNFRLHSFFFCVLKLFLVDMSLPMSTPFIYERMKNNSLRSFVPTLFQSVHLILIVFIVNSSFSFAENVVFSVCLCNFLLPTFFVITVPLLSLLNHYFFSQVKYFLSSPNYSQCCCSGSHNNLLTASGLYFPNTTIVLRPKNVCFFWTIRWNVQLFWYIDMLFSSVFSVK